MDVINIKYKIESISDTSNIYLIEALSEVAGFFVNDKKLLYMAKDTFGSSCEGIETDYLKLQMHVRISAVKNNQTFNDDYYNAIIYKGDLDDDNFYSFIHLCSIHAKNAVELNFNEFFYSLISLFQLPEEKVFKNAVGLYGELKFMQYVSKRRNLDISDSWHRRGSYSKYDFSNGNENIEIKTTLSENSEIIIKHQQIFNDYPCYLVVIGCDLYENGETIEELITSMYADPVAFKSINFSINLAKELKRVSNNDIKEARFCIRHISFFDPKKINPFPSIPENISKLSYALDVSEFEALPESTTDVIIENF